MRSKPARRIEDGVVEPGLFLRLMQPLLVGLDVGKVQGVGGAQAAVHQLIAGLEQQIKAFAGANLEVILALGANVEVGLQVRLEDDLAAAGTLDPESLGANSSLAGVPIALRGAIVLAIFALEPGHKASTIVYALRARREAVCRCCVGGCRRAELRMAVRPTLRADRNHRHRLFW